MLILALTWSLLLTNVSLGRSYLPSDQWNGEYLRANEGAFFIRFNLSNFKVSSRGRDLSSNITMTLKNIKSQHTYQISQPIQTTGQPRYIWKLPNGDYQIKKVSFIDNVGRNRVWAGKISQTFKVPKLSLSYFGLWNLSPFEKSGLQIRFHINEPGYQHQVNHQTFIHLINGLNGQTLMPLGGAAVVQNAQNNYGTQNEARATFSSVRKISMLYQLNLARHNKLSPAVAKTLGHQDLQLRNCYSDELDQNPNLFGNVKFQFLISKSNGAMSKIVYRGGTLQNKKVVNCLYYQLGQLQFPIASDVLGTITFQFGNQ